jgi:SAM-dependent methyltransferase
MSRVGERVLAALSRPPGAGDYDAARDPWTEDNALDGLRRAFPDLGEIVRGRRVLDFGCGGGWQAAALAREGAAFVLGVDTNERTLESARALRARLGLDPARLDFATCVAPDAGTFDVVVSQNAMEHFGDPAGVLRAMRAAMAPGGRLLVTFGPPWLAPSGSHMHFFTRVPWVNLLFSERTVMAVRARYRGDGARCYEEVESGLNRMTLKRFERTVAAAGLRFERRGYRGVKNLHFLGRIPIARELFVNVVDAVLVPAAAAQFRTGG